jgi:hypothetical protein
VTTGDASAIKGATDTHVANIATALAGGGLDDCPGDLAACLAAASSAGGALLRTGQATCWDTAGTVVACAGTGQDGELQKGLARAYVDNGDGTITDTKTGLMWEKLADDGSIHDKDNTYSWSGAFVRAATLNSGGGFAGHTDWRVPNRAELESLVSLGAFSPAVSPAFNTGCAPSCTVLTCSCTVSPYYWSSSTYQDYPAYAWGVGFLDGSVNAGYKPYDGSVRAVRGGS